MSDSWCLVKNPAGSAWPPAWWGKALSHSRQQDRILARHLSSGTPHHFNQPLQIGYRGIHCRATLTAWTRGINVAEIKARWIKDISFSLGLADFIDLGKSVSFLKLLLIWDCMVWKPVFKAMVVTPGQTAIWTEDYLLIFIFLCHPGVSEHFRDTCERNF